MAINAYVHDYKIKNIPVESDDVPDSHFFDRLSKLHMRIERLSDENGFKYRTYTDRNMEYSNSRGFEYLNSDMSSYYYKEIKYSIEGGLKALCNPDYDSIYTDWIEVIQKRENTMLKNIYDYSSSNPFDRTVFTIGAAHRESIIQKVLKLSNSEKIKLKWINI